MRLGIHNLSIHSKLSLLSLTFMLPIAALTRLFIEQSYKDIDFAAKEIVGVRYLAPLRELLPPLSAQNAASTVQALGELERVDRELGANLNLGDAAAKAIATARAAAASGERNAAERTEAFRRARAAAQNLIAAAGDGSNLILDPDLDSFYVMDLVVNKLPEAIDRAASAREAARDAIQAGKPALAKAAEAQQRLGELSGALAATENALRHAIKGATDAALLERALAAPIGAARDAGRAYADAVGEALEKGNPSAADKMEAAFLDRTAIAWKASSAELDRLLAQRISGFQTKMYVNLGASAVVLAAAIFLAWLITRSVSRPVSVLVKVMRRIAAGDLSVRVPLRNSRDEAGVLARTALEMRDRLHAIASDVQSHAKTLAGVTDGITRNIEGHAAVSHQMAASVAEITSTMEELSAASTHIAEHSQSVVEIANNTYESSKKGAEAMHVVVAKMNDIQSDNQTNLQEILELGSRSKEIGKIMEIIESVADQTKLIAFNAALEAASAGEAGRRFGVVAGEIRRLADSVTESTSEIETKIVQIQDCISRLVITSERGAGEIASGMETATRTAGELAELVEATRQTNSAAQQISLSTQQQKSASNQVVVALRDIVAAGNNSAQSIANIVEISKRIESLSNGLDAVARQFQLGGAPAETKE